MADNKLYYGDNLDILSRYVEDKSVDLVYLDPPFNSNQDYNVLFKERDGSRSAAQIKAFKDTWIWDQEASHAYQEMIEGDHEEVSKVLRAFHTFLGFNDMLAYLSMMAPRLVELRRVLKDTGSIYLHCDPTASHYLKMLMDAVFGPANFRNEIAWKRTPFAGSSKARARQFPASHDVILFYSRGDKHFFVGERKDYEEDYYRRFKNPDNDPRGPYQSVLLKTYSQATFERLREEGKLIPAKSDGARWRYKQFVSELKGRQVDDIWTDINMINPVAKERLGYPTQKPEALLERIINASSSEGDMVLDPFCGCGTTIAVAQRLNRRWIGIDVTCLAITLMRRRLESTFDGKAEFDVIGEPTAYSEAKQLAAENPYQFQWWALDLVGARPVIEKKGADKGVDGRLLFHDDDSGETKQVILSVKAGRLALSHVRDLRGVIEREHAEIGCLISLEEPTKNMREEAAEAGFYQHPLGKKMYPRLQLVTVKDLLEGKKLQLPESRVDVTFKKAPRTKAKQRAFTETDTNP